MGFDTGRVVFDKDDLTYVAGQVVSGRLEFQQDKVKTFRGIHVTAIGECHTHWTTSHSRTVNGRSETYYKSHDAHEVYFEIRTYLIGGKSGECQLKPGKYSFPFQVALPANCPSSFEGNYGHIRYKFKFVVDRAFKLDQEKNLTITVMALNDLNMNHYCREPMWFEFHETLHVCCCFSMGKYEVTAKVPQSGFCPGQAIPIELRCLNDTTVNIRQIKFEIEETIRYRTTDDTKYRHRTISKLKKGRIPSNTTRQWELEMLIPEMDLPNVAACRWIDIDYEFKVTVCPEGCHSNSDASKCLILGHIPLRNLNDPNQMGVEQAGMQQSSEMFPPVYPNHSPYPVEKSPYPLDPGYQGNSPYPPANPSYPGGDPGGNSPYPPGNSPYPPGNPPYPPGNSPYPAGNPPYPPEKQPYPSGDPSYPGGNSPYPPQPNVSPYPSNPPYPGAASSFGSFKPMPAMPVPSTHVGFPMPTPSENNQPGQMPMPNSASPNPYAAASAPEPATPEFHEKNPMP